MYVTSETSNDAICVHHSGDFEVSKFILFRDIVTQYISIITWIYYKLAPVQIPVMVTQLFYSETLRQLEIHD